MRALILFTTLSIFLYSAVTPESDPFELEQTDLNKFDQQFIDQVIGSGNQNPTNPPNIVIVIADDVGWNDVGYHRSSIPTPVIDSMSENGIRLENYYVHTTCTPSRASLFTGRISQNHGLAHALLGFSPFGITKNHKMLSEALKDRGYRNYYSGKWHLGYSRVSFTPKGKGYDRSLCLYNGAVTQFDQMLERSRDLSEDGIPILNVNRTYSSDLYTDKSIQYINEHATDIPMHLVLSHQTAHTPLEAPSEYLKP